MRYAIGIICFMLAATGSASASQADNIPWHKGDVEAAFATAKADNKPLFLYWGAVWCPPCNQIKKTIFSTREFQEKMEVFLPVYLDGDTESAQLWGEKFGTKGYPTMIVFSPEGQEIVRLPGGLQVDEFVEVLDQSLEEMRPLREVMDHALTAVKNDITDGTWRLIAYHSWGQDHSTGYTDTELTQHFWDLERKCPPRLAAVKARLFTLWLESKIGNGQAESESQYKLDEVSTGTADLKIHRILDNYDLSVSNLSFVLYSAGDVLTAMYPKPHPKRTSLMRRWETILTRVEEDATLSVDERLSTLVTRLELHQIDRGKSPLPESFKEDVKARAWWAHEASDDDYTRQSAMSTAGWLLRQVGLNDDAKRLYLAQLDKAVSPHYFMSSLSTIAKKDGDTKEAVDWLKKAYEASEGPATRFQWGTNYLIGLMSLTPSRTKQIRAESSRVLTELLSHDDAFAGRNQKRIRSLSKSYKKWSANRHRKGLLSALKTELVSGCDQLAAKSEESSGRCRSFFDELG